MHRPFVSFRHLERMTDDTGLLEHSLGSIPRRKEGYTTDDNARALWVCVERLEAASFIPLTAEQEDAVSRLIDTYLSFLLWAQQEDGAFHNNFGYDRRPEPEQRSDDCLGRALWACAVAFVKLKQPERRFVAGEMLRKALPRCTEMVYPRGWAYALAACSLMLQESGGGAADAPQHSAGERLRAIRAMPEWRSILERLERQLLQSYADHAADDWRWFEPVMSYGNGLLPWSLLLAHRVTGNRQSLEIAESSLQFLISQMTAPQGWIRPVGTEGWCTRDHRSTWDQQPLDVMKLALACKEAYVSLGKPEYRHVVEKCRAWFYGDNDKRQALADAEEGSCCDGLTPDGANLNQGAESTLAYLLTELIYCSVTGARSAA